MDGYLGEIRAFGFTFVPRGWLQCNGNILPIQQYAALFSILGTNYGGNGTTTFALPNYSGRGPVSQGQGPGLSNYVVGESIGSEYITLNQTTMPAHSHIVHNKVLPSAITGLSNVPTNATSLSRLSSPAGTPSAPYLKPPLTQPVIMHPLSVGITGSSNPHENRQPYLPLMVCICIEGVFPTRN
ncbi:phage tail protein [Sphingomonas sp.]|uniref:phage tail protein n=1 Tax=Sphingomonas sp. TaxID=28214 RepID=UPI003D6CB136